MDDELCTLITNAAFHHENYELAAYNLEIARREMEKDWTDKDNRRIFDAALASAKSCHVYKNQYETKISERLRDLAREAVRNRK